MKTEPLRSHRFGFAAFALSAAFAAGLGAQAHPHFDDGGTLRWSTTLAEAKVAAQKQDRLIFVQYGRKACGNCRSLVEKVLPDAAVKARMSAGAIGLAIDCDAPDEAVAQLLDEKLPGATALPFVAFLTSDGKWIDGFSGYRNLAEFTTVLDKVEKSPLLEAAPAVRKQLEKLAAGATAAADKGDWKAVLAASREARKSRGRCPEREAIRDADQRAREWVAAQFDAIVADAGAGADLAPARQKLADVKRHFAGEPELQDAETGSRALLRLQQIRDAETLPNPAKDLREKAAAMFPRTRWAGIFARPGEPAKKG